jgi:hypothetical protein
MFYASILLDSLNLIYLISHQPRFFMDMSANNIETLFAQLGLNNSPEEITQFAASHKLAKEVYINNAPFWSDGQRHFLQEALREDSDWTEVVDQLNVLLH